MDQLMTRRGFIISFGLGVTGLSCRQSAHATEGTSSSHPNVFFFAVDDMNDWTSLLRGYTGKVRTPNQERLAKMGVSFTNAQTASPVCCSSRTAMNSDFGLLGVVFGVNVNSRNMWWLLSIGRECHLVKRP
jgi:hypothetical protein